MRTLGVSITGGVLYLAALDELEPSSEQLGAPVAEGMRLKPNMGLPEAERVADLRDRFAQDVRSLAPASVGVVATRQYNKWVYKNAYSRITAHTAVMIACSELGFDYIEVKTESIARVVDVLANNLSAALPQKFGLPEGTRYWAAGLAEAYGAAAALLVSNREPDNE